MADTNKTTETKVDPEGKVTPEKETVKKETAKKETVKKETAKKETVKKEAKKVYIFTSANKWLTCTGLGVQFIDGKAKTERLEVAKELVKIEGVTLVEE